MHNVVDGWNPTSFLEHQPQARYGFFWRHSLGIWNFIIIFDIGVMQRISGVMVGGPLVWGRVCASHQTTELFTAPLYEFGEGG